MKTVKQYKDLLNVFDVLSENLTDNCEYVNFAHFDFDEDTILFEGVAIGYVRFEHSEETEINETIYKTICNLLTLSNIEFESEMGSDCCEFRFEDYKTIEFDKYSLHGEL